MEGQCLGLRRVIALHAQGLDRLSTAARASDLVLGDIAKRLDIMIAAFDQPTENAYARHSGRSKGDPSR